MASDPLQYYIGKGVVSFTPYTTGTTLGTKRDLGNVPEFELTPEIETLDHFSSRTGVRTKDRSIVLSKAMTVRIVMEEWTPENLAMALLGTVSSDTVGGGSDIDIFSKNSVSGVLEFVAAGEVGPDITLTLYNVTFNPGSSINMLSDEWGSIEVTGEALVAASGTTIDSVDVSGKFGKVDLAAATS